MSTVAQRALVSLVIATTFVTIAWLGGWWFFVPIVLLFGLAATEFSQIAKKLDLLVPIGLLLPGLGAHWLAVQVGRLQNETFFATAFVLLLWSLFRYERSGRQRAGHDLVMSLAALMLFGWFGGHLLKLRAYAPETGSEAWQWTVVAVCAIWMVDFFAYGVGKFIAGRGILGRHALSPRLSPNKSIEGLIGGTMLGSLLAVGIGVGLFDLPLTAVLMMTICVAILNPAGDLVISMFKRTAKVKDTGTLFPGHGGALDRVDSLLIGAPIAWYIHLLMQSIL